MAKWTISITVINTLDRPLVVTERRSEWGIWEEGKNPASIDPGSRGTFAIYAPSSAAWGPELYLGLADDAPSGKKSYGSVNILVSIPYGAVNQLDVVENGILSASGYAQLPNSEHNYITTMTIFKK